jgi:hypothetical protein
MRNVSGSTLGIVVQMAKTTIYGMPKHRRASNAPD